MGVATGRTSSFTTPSPRVIRVVASSFTTTSPPQAIRVVTSTNFYADVVRQIGGRSVSVLGVLSNPSTDPHTYESSTTDAAAVAQADLIVQNGLGYDNFMQNLETSSPRAGRVVVDVGKVFGRKDGDNPHQWYDPATMPRVAALTAAVLSRFDPARRGVFAANVARFDASLKPWVTHIAALKARYKDVSVAVTEPVFDYETAVLGLRLATPHSFELAVQEGNDPAPQDVHIERNLLSTHAVKVFFYNQQVVEPLTLRLLGIARSAHVPVVGVYETEPSNKSYQAWMEAETNAVDRALRSSLSTEQIH